MIGAPLPTHVSLTALILLGSRLLFASPGTASDGPARLEEPDTDALIADLGGRRWSEREEAGERILQLGDAALPRLREAARSSNLERAYRASQLLDRLDPLVTDLEIVRLRLGDVDEPAMPIALATALSSSDPVVSLTPTPLDNVPRGPPAFEPRTYTLRQRTRSSGVVDLSAEEGASPSSTTSLALHRPLSAHRGISILKRTEECSYQSLGTTMTRTRERYLILLVVRQHRELSDADEGLPRDAQELREELVTLLLEQAVPQSERADEASLRSRTQALEILVALRSTRAKPAFQAALDVPELRHLALLGLGEIEGLEEILVAARTRNEASPDRDNAGAARSRSSDGSASPVSVFVAACERLLGKGRENGLEFIVEELVRADPYTLHDVMSLASEALERGKLSPPAKQRLIDTVLGQEFLGRAVWSLRETEHLISAATIQLDPENPDDRARAAAVQSRLERLFCGDLGTTPLPYTVFLELWRRAQRILGDDPTAEAFLSVSLLPCLARSQQLSLAQKTVDRSLSRGLRESERALDQFLDELRGHLETEDAVVQQAAAQLLLTTSRSLDLRPEWLEPTVRLLVDALSSLEGRISPTSLSTPRSATMQSKTVLRRGLEGEIVRWTGVRTAAVPVRRDGFATRWKTWLDDDDQLSARREELSRALSGTTDSEQESFLYTFSLRVPGRSPPRASERGTEDARSLELLDGRVVRLGGLEPARYQDIFGVWHYVQLVSSTARGVSSFVQITIDGTTIRLQEEHPLLRVWSRSAPSTRTYETSDVYFGSRYVSRPQPSTYKLLLYYDQDPPPPEIAESDPARVLDWLIDERLLAGQAGGTTQRVDAVAAVLEALRPEQAKEYLFSAFRASPTPARAKALVLLGDPSATEYLHELAKGEDRTQRSAAALILVELGDRVGVRVLLEELGGQSSGNLTSRALTALDRYLLDHRGRDTLRREILDLYFDLLPQTAWQYRAFRTLERELGSDFGYRDAQRSTQNIAARRAALAEAARRAQTWWDAHRESYVQTPGDTE